ncbi:hypothetical protein RB195_014488 [Necator americanus]|uniref:Uncharacterized protein n=1 Tax=Necator americanus TaxID=51031 RepID=A0ABR1E0A2_NECAM
MSFDWSHREYYVDDAGHYASPVFNSSRDYNNDTVPRKQAPSLRRHSTCRPTTALYLPHKKPKSTFRSVADDHCFGHPQLAKRDDGLSRILVARS